MPLVNGKKFPYTPAGKKAAKKAILKKMVNVESTNESAAAQKFEASRFKKK